MTHRSRTSTVDPIIVIDSSEIREGKIDELKAGLTKLVDFVEANEAEPIAYRIYIDEDGGRMTVVQIHPSSASMELHMRLAGPIFQEFAELVVISRVDFYGTPSAAVLEDAAEGRVARECARRRERAPRRICTIRGWLRTPFEMKTWPPGRAGRRDSASSVAPVFSNTSAPCVLASHAPSTPRRRGVIPK